MRTCFLCGRELSEIDDKDENGWFLICLKCYEDKEGW